MISEQSVHSTSLMCSFDASFPHDCGERGSREGGGRGEDGSDGSDGEMRGWTHREARRDMERREKKGGGSGARRDVHVRFRGESLGGIIGSLWRFSLKEAVILLEGRVREERRGVGGGGCTSGGLYLQRD